MNAKDLSKMTITENGYILGRTIKGKGVEILTPSKIVYSSKSSAYKLYIEDDLKKISEIKAREDFSDLYVSQYRYDADWFNPCTFATQHLSLDDFIVLYEKEPERINQFTISKKEQIIGHVSLSKYKSDRDSQVQLCEDLLELQNITIYLNFEDGYEIDYTDEAFKFDSSFNGKYCDGDYTLEHGYKICQKLSDADYFNGRMSNHNYSYMEFANFNEDEYLSEIDPDETISVCHRKSKDWYVGYSLDSHEMYIYYKRDDCNYEKSDFEEEVLYLQTYKENQELKDKVLEYLKSTKEDLEMNCFIENELDVTNDYRDCGVDFEVVELCFDDISSLKELIISSIDWDYEKIKENFIVAYNNAINKRIKVLDNFKVEVECYSMFNGSTVTTFNQFAVLKRLEKRLSFQLVYSAVSNSISSTTWAIKQGNEEYHFSLPKFLVDVNDGTVTVTSFLECAFSAIEKRRLEKINEAELYEKASKIFVGLQDSISSGNCEFGTKQFILKHQIDHNSIGGIRGDVLLDMEQSNFTKRAVYYAIATHTTHTHL